MAPGVASIDLQASVVVPGGAGAIAGIDVELTKLKTQIGRAGRQSRRKCVFRRSPGTVRAIRRN